ELRAGVLELEVEVAARMGALVARELPLHPHAGERAGEDVLDGARELADGEDAVFGSGQRGQRQTRTVELWRSAAMTVESTTMATVMGPTPPGTGVIARATWRTDSKSTSPVIRPRPPAASVSRWMPTSTTTAPGFTQSALTRCRRPTAATSRSASRASD